MTRTIHYFKTPPLAACATLGTRGKMEARVQHAPLARTSPRVAVQHVFNGPWGTSNEVALLHSTAQFESRLNRFSTPVLPDTPRFESTGGPGPLGQETSAVVFNSDSDFLNA